MSSEPLRIDLRQPPFAEPATTDLGYIRYRHRDFEEVQRRREWNRLHNREARKMAPNLGDLFVYRSYVGISLYTDPDHILADALGWTDGPLPAFVAEYVDLLGGFRAE